MVSEEELFAEERRRARKRKQKEEEERKRRDRYFIRKEIRKKQEQEASEAFAEGYEAGAALGHAISEMDDVPKKAEKDYSKSESLFKKEANSVSAMDILDELAEIEEEDSPFRKLHDEIAAEKEANEHTEQAVTSFIEGVSTVILSEVRAEVNQRKKDEEGFLQETDGAIQRRKDFEFKMNLRMNFVRKTMAADAFENLCAEVREAGLDIQAEQFTGLAVSDFRKQKATLGLKAMKELASGQTPFFYKMMHSTEEFIASNKEQEKDVSERLVKDIAEFVAKDCAPNNRAADDKAFRTAMYTLKAMLPEKKFNQFVEQLNHQPGRGSKYKAEDFSRLPKRGSRAAEAAGPVLKIDEGWEEL